MSACFAAAALAACFSIVELSPTNGEMLVSLGWNSSDAIDSTDASEREVGSDGVLGTDEAD